MMKYQVLCVLIIAFSSIISIQAKIDLDTVKKLADSCNVKEDDWGSLKKLEVPETESGKCLMLCMLKGIKTLDANGKFDSVGAKAGLDAHWTEFTPEERSMIVDSCAKAAEPWAEKVNTCEYGYHAAKCINSKMMEKKPELFTSL